MLNKNVIKNTVFGIGGNKTAEEKDKLIKENEPTK